MTDQPDTAADMFGPDALARLLAKAAARNERDARAKAAIPAQATDDRARWLSDRHMALLAGKFPALAIDRAKRDDFRPTVAMAKAREFATSGRPILVLLGGVGTGKTNAATWLAREIGGARPGLVRSTALERRGRYDRDHDEWVSSRTFLVVDDLGVEFLDGKGAFLSLLDELVDVAIGDGRRLMLTANLSRQDLADRVQARIWSRVCESGMVADCGRDDLRRGGA